MHFALSFFSFILFQKVLLQKHFIIISYFFNKLCNGHNGMWNQKNCGNELFFFHFLIIFRQRHSVRL